MPYISSKTVNPFLTVPVDDLAEILIALVPSARRFEKLTNSIRLEIESCIENLFAKDAITTESAVSKAAFNSVKVLHGGHLVCTVEFDQDQKDRINIYVINQHGSVIAGYYFYIGSGNNTELPAHILKAFKSNMTQFLEDCLQ